MAVESLGVVIVCVISIHLINTQPKMADKREEEAMKFSALFIRVWVLFMMHSRYTSQWFIANKCEFMMLCYQTLICSVPAWWLQLSQIEIWWHKIKITAARKLFIQLLWSQPMPHDGAIHAAMAWRLGSHQSWQPDMWWYMFKYRSWKRRETMGITCVLSCTIQASAQLECGMQSSSVRKGVRWHKLLCCRSLPSNINSISIHLSCFTLGLLAMVSLSLHLDLARSLAFSLSLSLFLALARSLLLPCRSQMQNHVYWVGDLCCLSDTFGHYLGYLVRAQDFDGCPLFINTAMECGKVIKGDPCSYLLIADPTTPYAQINDPKGTGQTANLIADLMSRGYNATKKQITPNVLRMRCVKTIMPGKVAGTSQ